ncbi:hypothetical protein [Enterovibrio norvegicus]|uniref:hypothetical protein n=1 Tax=Enterovibrio norvegicus TaxID=188144 RepID=UPI0013044D37|nr:hypothetical protein [Enterovibrio norvegicus]MCC4798519.1 hypothetical protein [Enterovibrio norvegicus]
MFIGLLYTSINTVVDVAKSDSACWGTINEVNVCFWCDALTIGFYVAHDKCRFREANA